ncbi:MAG: cation:proton antiporter [Robiginitomaculum sp.]|nr:MAG: cation:proton antiporter [Robiginitomaculum sp.]
MVRSALLLLCVLVAYWFTLSGYFDHTVLLVTGGISILLVIGLAARMKLLDSETVPYGKVKTLGYFVWLFKEIGKANMIVVKAVLNPDMKISPSMISVDMKQSTDLGRTVFANSITLTPGTISVELEDGQIKVHALLTEMTDLSGFEEMSERAGRAVNDPMLGKPAKKTKKPARKGK